MGDDPYEGIELTDLRELCRAQHDQLEKLHSPIAASELSGVYDRQKAGENERLALAIWTADFAACMEALRAANVELVAVLDAQITSSTPKTEVAVAH